MVNSEGKVHLRGWRTHRQIFVQTHRGQYRGLVGRGVRELALFRVRLRVLRLGLRLDMFDWSDMIFTTSTHIWTKVVSIIIRCPEDYHLSSPV